MKILRNTLTVFLLVIGFNAFSQSNNPKLEQALTKGLDMIKAAKGSEDFLKSANYFERIAQVETKAWMPQYYAAYSNLIAGVEDPDNKLKDQLWDKGLLEIEQADRLSPENSEIYALKGYLEYMKLSIDPQSRLTYMGQSAASLAQAKRLNPENPRIYLISGQNTFWRRKEKRQAIVRDSGCKICYI
jgi:hypothetical protein